MKNLFKTSFFLLLTTIFFQSCTSDESGTDTVSEEQKITTELTEKIITTATSLNDYNFFVSNASKMSSIAITFLFLFALLLISAIDTSLNKIWQVTTKRRVITAFSMYWMVLTLGPVLVGSSIAATSYIVSLISIGDYDLFGLTNIALRALPIFASICAFLVLYMIVPNKEVLLKHALFGATLAALLFEIAKKGFAFYITQLPSYEAIYGALAGIPILFLWVYLSWLVVLFGALFTVTLEKFNPEHYHQR